MVALLVMMIGALPGLTPSAGAADPVVVTVATHNLEPFVMTRDGIKSGFTIELLEAVAERENVTLEYVDVANVAEQLQAVAEGRVDAVLRFLLSPRSAFVTCQPFNVSKDTKGDDAPTTQPLEGKVVLLTGAARGIGESTARIMAAEGAHVVCLDLPRDDEPLSKVARSIGGSVLLADITDPDAPELICKELNERFGGVDIVVHNAGITRDKLLANMKPQLWDMAVDVNLGAVIRITEKMVSNGVLNDGGRVICLSSVSGIAGNRGQTNYSASKAGIVGFVQSLAPQLAARGVTVNAIAPGFIETRLTSAMPVGIREGARRLSALGQGGHPEDVGQAITFLSTPGAVGITGSVLRVCGGALVGA